MLENDAMLCWWIVLNIKLKPQSITWAEWFVRGGEVEWLPRAIHLAVNPGLVWWLLPRGTLVDGHPGTKRLLRLPCFRVLSVQPYDIMGSILIEYDVRVQLVAWHQWYLGTGLASMVEFSFWNVSSHSSLWVEWVLRWKCTTPAGCKTNRLAMSTVMDNLSL
jgi:hypothetical protein